VELKQDLPFADGELIRTVDLHAAGEPLRVVVGGLAPVPGADMLEKRRYAQEHLDGVRRRLMWEPRGHADMYGAIVTDPVREDSDCGVLFLHNEGFSTMCGHGIIALTTFLVQTGRFGAEQREPVVRIDAPAGLIVARARRDGDRVASVTFENVPSFVYRRDIAVRLNGLGETLCHVAFGGAYYAFCDAADLGLTLEPAQHDRLVQAGKQLKRAVVEQCFIDDPVAPDLGFLYGVIFTGPPAHSAHHSRHVCIFAEGELDRSPTGTGVSARAALLDDDGSLGDGEEILIESILGTCFGVRVAARTRVGGFAAVVPEVSGEAHFTGASAFVLDPDDPIGEGFVFR
jgi:proline racemase